MYYLYVFFLACMYINYYTPSLQHRFLPTPPSSSVFSFALSQTADHPTERLVCLLFVFLIIHVCIDDIVTYLFPYSLARNANAQKKNILVVCELFYCRKFTGQLSVLLKKIIIMYTYEYMLPIGFEFGIYRVY